MQYACMCFESCFQRLTVLLSVIVRSFWYLHVVETNCNNHVCVQNMQFSLMILCSDPTLSYFVFLLNRLITW